MKTIRDLLCPTTERTKYMSFESAGEMAAVALNNIEDLLVMHDDDPGKLLPLPERVRIILEKLQQRIDDAENVVASPNLEWWEQ